LIADADLRILRAHVEGHRHRLRRWWQSLETLADRCRRPVDHLDGERFGPVAVGENLDQMIAREQRHLASGAGSVQRAVYANPRVLGLHAELILTLTGRPSRRSSSKVFAAYPSASRLTRRLPG